MTIERFIYQKPVSLPSLTALGEQLDAILLLGKREIVPPGYSKDITPAGSDVRKMRLTTWVEPGREVEDTVGEITVVRESGHQEKYAINDQRPLFVLVGVDPRDPSCSLLVTGIVRYVPSFGAKETLDVGAAAAIPVELPRVQEVGRN